jgi:AcrR family transcriptional regulator
MSPRTAKQFELIRGEKRQQIIYVAVRLFADKGFHASSISMIAKEAGISKGLLYNYFDSKEALLQTIMDEITVDVMNMMNPDHDDEITSKEMEDFFSLIFSMMKKNNEHWKLYFQISLQKDVFELLKKEEYSEKIMKSQQLIYKYFTERFENPQLEMFLFASIFKGFSMQYVFAPELFSDEMIDKFKQRLKSMFIKDKL